MRNSTKIILFNILIILTIILIYLLFFPKKSYTEKLLEKNPEAEEVFNSNINSMKIAAINYFENNETEKVTLDELIKKELLFDLKDSNNNSCKKESYAEKHNDKITIDLKCEDKEDKIEFNIENNIENKKRKKLFCLYEYTKETNKEYTDWSDWSEWTKDEKEKNDLTNVETKTETIEKGTKTVYNTKTISIDANKYVSLACPNGYQEEDSRCKKKQELNTINASIKYTCPNGYTKSGTKCYKGNNYIDATKSYYCPQDGKGTEYKLSNDKCKIYNVIYYDTSIVEYKYYCDSSYYLDGTKCNKQIEYEEEVKDYEEVTYYRYQTRNKIDKKNDIIWSSKDNKDLLNKSYNMTREISCEF